MNATDSNVDRQPHFAKTGQQLLGSEWSQEIEQQVTTKDMEVQHGAVPTIVLGQLFPVVKNERNTNKSRFQVSEVPFSGDNTSPGAPQFTTRATKIWTPPSYETLMKFSALVNVTKILQSRTTGIGALAFGDLKRTTRVIDTNHEELEIQHSPAFTSLPSIEFEDEFSLPVAVTQTIVALGTGASPSIGFELLVTALDVKHALKTAKQFTDQSGFTYYDEIKFTYPSLLLAVETDTAFVVPQSRSYFQVNGELRDAFELLVPAKIDVTFTATQQNPPTLFQPLSHTLHYDGTLFRAYFPNVINNGFTLTATTNTDDTFWGSVVSESHVFPASPTTLAVYNAAIGTLQPVSFKSERWKYNLYKNVLVSVPIL